MKEIFEALQFAADKHKYQKRKGTPGIPYINHPIDVAALLLQTMDTPDKELIIASLLHDTLEDTITKPDEIKVKFGRKVLELVEEVTDDMNLSAAERKNQQILKASTLSFGARCLKIADKTCNIRDILFTRIKWMRFRKIAYIRWACQVVSGIRSTHKGLEESFDAIVKKSEELLDTKFL